MTGSLLFRFDALISGFLMLVNCLSILLLLLDDETDGRFAGVVELVASILLPLSLDKLVGSMVVDVVDDVDVDVVVDIVVAVTVVVVVDVVGVVVSLLCSVFGIFGDCTKGESVFEGLHGVRLIELKNFFFSDNFSLSRC